MRHRNTPSGTLTFDHTTREGFDVVATCQYDAGDRSVGIWPGWHLIEATVAEAVILDCDAFARHLGSQELDKIEEHAGDLPRRASDPHALPDVEVFQGSNYCVACSLAEAEGHLDPDAWYYWPCFPGCLPDGEPVGPFASEAEALADAQEVDAR
jgi:hypothetical protein